MRKRWVLRRLPSRPTIRAPCAEVDLGLLAGPAFQAAEWQFARRLQPTDEAPDAVVAAGEVVLGDQILVDALGAEARDRTWPGSHRARARSRSCDRGGSIAGTGGGDRIRLRAVEPGAHWLVLTRHRRDRAGGRNGWF